MCGSSPAPPPAREASLQQPHAHPALPAPQSLPTAETPADTACCSSPPSWASRTQTTCKWKQPVGMPREVSSWSQNAFQVKQTSKRSGHWFSKSLSLEAAGAGSPRALSSSSQLGKPSRCCSPPSPRDLLSPHPANMHTGEWAVRETFSSPCCCHRFQSAGFKQKPVL